MRVQCCTGEGYEKRRKDSRVDSKFEKYSFTGSIRISYDLGGIQRVEKYEEILKKGKL
jgi:hypothetical protein